MKAAETPDATGHFGKYGGMFVPETLMAPLQELASVYEHAKKDPEFRQLDWWPEISLTNLGSTPGEA